MSKHDIQELLISVAIAVFVFLAIQSMVQTATVDGASMEPLLHSGERLLINKAAYWYVDRKTMFWLPQDKAAEQQAQAQASQSNYWNQGAAPLPEGRNIVDVFAGVQRGDLVVFNPPNNQYDVYIKRVIALPGEKIEIKNGYVYINDQMLDEPYVEQRAEYYYSPAVIPKGYVFVLGDNRNHSSDSVRFGMLPRENIIGRAELRVWPLNLSHLVLSQQKPVFAKK